MSLFDFIFLYLSVGMGLVTLLALISGITGNPFETSVAIVVIFLWPVVVIYFVGLTIGSAVDKFK